MANLFRKALGAFVETEPEVPPEPPAAPRTVQEARALSATRPPSMQGPVPAPGPGPAATDMTVEDIYAAAGVRPGPALKVQRMLDALGGASPDARRTAVQAFLVADGSFTAEDAVRDALQRQQILDGYVTLLVEAEQQALTQAADKSADIAVTAQAELEEVARQIAALGTRQQVLQDKVAEAARMLAAAKLDIASAHQAARGRGQQAAKSVRDLIEFLKAFAGTPGA